MPAYMMFIREDPIHDQAAMDEYTKRGTGTSKGHNLKPLAVYGKVEAVEGKAPDGVILLEFPSVAEAKAWYNSPAYQAAVPFRKKGANYRAIILEGL